MILKTRVSSLLLCLAATSSALAQNNNAPEILYRTGNESFAITRLSNNGKWGICSMSTEVDEGGYQGLGGMLTNLETMSMEIYTSNDPSIPARLTDVTDDGNILVGSYNDKPAYYNRATGEWVTLPLPEGFEVGHLLTVTPDGKKACGFLTRSASNRYQYDPAYYNLETKEYIPTPGFPALDMNHENRNFNLFTDISADGRYLLGCMSQDILEPRAMCSFVYDTADDTYQMIGFIDHPDQPWEPLVEDLYFIKNAYMSPQGNYVTGYAWLYHEGTHDHTYQVSFLYDVATKEFKIYDGDGDSGVQGISVDNNGIVYAKTPADNPYAECMVRSGSFFYTLDQIFKQVYGIDFEETTGLATTGMPITVSGDGMTLVMQSYDECYLLKLKEPLAQAATQVNLLADYTVSPEAGTAFNTLSTLSVTFERAITVNKAPAEIKLIGPDGNEIRGAAKAEADGRTLSISFRATEMVAESVYSIKIPAGFLSLASAPEVTSDEIVINYEGRDNVPVQLVVSSPADGTSVPKLDSETNPLLLTFDSYLKLNSSSDLGLAYLYDGEETTPYCSLYIMCADRRLLVYPAQTVYLFKGTDYRVVIPQGTVTDLSGKGPNDEITLNFSGSYERTISQDDIYLFNEGCDNYLNFMFYEGDHNTPQSVPQSWGFTADTTPWSVVRDSEDTVDMAFATHSMYTPAGQSDDWCVIPQLFIPDDRCLLEFDSQSYLRSKSDRLKVIILESDEVCNVLKSDFVEKIRNEGTVVYNEVQVPGKDEEMLIGDWQNNVISLADYAGKNIYIAFLNDNYDQSAVFIDNIRVMHDLQFLTSLENKTRVVNLDEINITGSVVVASELDTFSSISLVLRGENGEEIDRIEESGLAMGKNYNYHFSFSNPLPLRPGYETFFTIDVKLDEETSTYRGSIKDLTFEPVKSVVLEEYTGVTCPNCPRGIVAIENIQRLWGKKFIPLGIHTYSSDPLGSGLSSYTSFLGCDQVGAPSGRVNRGTRIAAPLSYTASGTATFSGRGIYDAAGNEDLTWLDLVNDEMATPADAQIAISTSYDAESSNVNVDVDVSYALNVEGVNYNLFTVVTEDEITSFQMNNLYGSTDEVYGEWGQGGAYGRSTVAPYTHHHVVRGVVGTTFNGTGGLLPTTFEAGEPATANISFPLPSSVSNPDNCNIVVMLIDTNTDRIVNATHAHLGGASDGIEAATVAPRINIAAYGSTVIVNAPGNFCVEVYNIAGQRIAAAYGEDSIALDNLQPGMAIVRVATADAAVAKKLIIK